MSASPVDPRSTNYRARPLPSIARLLTAIAILSLPRTAFADPPNLTEPAILPGDTETAPAAGKQWTPEIASGNGMFLAVWVDARTSPTVLPENVTGGAVFANENGSMNDIFAARLDAEGNVIDTTPIVVAQQIQNQAIPDVAWNGENWLVVWTGELGIACCPRINIYAARVSPSGSVLDDPPITVDADQSNSGLYWPTVESDGTNWVVVWRDLDQAAGIFTLDGARIAANGTILDPGGVRLRRDVSNSYPIDPDLAFAGDRYLLTWTEDSGEVKGQLLTPTLGAIGGVFQINTYSPTTGLNPRVATNGTDFLVAYWEDRYYAWTQLRAVRVSHQGQILDPAGIEITEAYGYTNYEPAVTWDGAYYFIAFDKDAFLSDIRAARITSQGAVLDFDGFLVAGDPSVQNQAAVAPRAGGGVVAVWKDYRNGGAHLGDIYGSTVTRDAEIGPLVAISLGAPQQTSPNVTVGPDGYLTVFRSATALGVRILAQRVDPTGAAIDLEPVEVAAGSDAIQNPAVDWNGSVFLVVWEDGTSIYGRRLDQDAVPIDSAPFPILPGEMPDVAALGETFLVVSSHEAPHEIRPIKGARVRGADGAVLDSSPILIGPSFSEWPRVAALGQRWIAVWEQYPSHDNPRSNVGANFIDSGGSAGSTFFVQYSSIPSEYRPDVAPAGDFALIVWGDGRTNPEYEDIYGRRIHADGSFIDPTSIPIALATNEQWDPQVAWDGTRFVVEHWDSREDGQYDQHRGDLWGVLLDAAGQPIDPSGFEVFSDAVAEIQPALAARAGTALLAGAVFRAEPPYGAYRIGIRMLDAQITAVAQTAASPRLALTAAPNPASGAVSFLVNLPAGGPTEVVVYDALGREVRRLQAGTLPAGASVIPWDGRDAGGHEAARGIYLARVRAAGEERTAKLVRR